MNKFQRFELNTAGRDFAVGDVHGHFTKLQAALDAAGFNPATDRLFSVGDLVDRGPESADVDTWLAKPWFFAVQGNHEAMVYDAYHFDPDGRAGNLHVANGGAWMIGLPSVERGGYAALLADLPIAIEVVTAEGLIGIVHADCPFPAWSTLRDALNGLMPGLLNVDAVCQWSRSRITDENCEGVSGVRAVIVGHTPVRQPAILGNVYHIDTGAWMGGHFTLIDLTTLQCYPPVNPKLNWDWEERP
ncbi:metallophosphoesterase [Pseudomonas tolaasii]|uniref:Metallophosphoesterase n=1 Tax=Pseudomonas tolaasii TaxID=29442 RepID=A0A7Y8ASZ4_PSETO|nr:metallophosphoesterase [Pseudomonas tolaasii]NWC24038.1 metallophosphoesterase [Pseudomonas tolaasii]NWD38233.1 metallophosphoesterase [Pseudomonas tolaasii]